MSLVRLPDARRVLDERALASLSSAPTIGEITGFASHDAFRSGQRLSRAEREAGRARLYSIEYRFEHLVGPGQTADRAVAIFDASASDYPRTKPTVTFRRKPFPFSQHVHPSNGVVCLGTCWDLAAGHMLLAELVVHVMHLVNFDEPDRGTRWDGYTYEALEYWERELRGQPFNPALTYPVLPTAITHGTVREAPAFRRTATVARVQVAVAPALRRASR